MIIHVVQPGETINTIADNYGIPVDRLILENEFVDPNNFEVEVTITPSAFEFYSLILSMKLKRLYNFMKIEGSRNEPSIFILLGNI